MHTTQTAIVFSIVFAVLCGIISLNPIMYARTHEIARLSVNCQYDSNQKDSIFKVEAKNSKNIRWEVEMSCPEKAYRLGNFGSGTSGSHLYRGRLSTKAGSSIDGSSFASGGTDPFAV